MSKDISGPLALKGTDQRAASSLQQGPDQRAWRRSEPTHGRRSISI
ncbi:hypothetical protein Tco_0544305, partial [Tanacetum coccineum]